MFLLLPDNVKLLRKWFRAITYFYIIKEPVSLIKCILESPARTSTSLLYKVRSRSSKTSQSQLLNSQSRKPSAATEAVRASATSSYTKLLTNPSLEAVVPDARATKPDARAKRVRAGVKETDPRVFLFLSDYLQSEDKGCFISFLCNIHIHSRLLRSGSKRKFKRFL